MTLISKIESVAKQHNLSLRFVLLPGVAVYIAFVVMSAVFGEQSAWTQALMPALITAVVGWRNSVVQDNRNFIMSENARAKEYIAELVDNLFNELDSKLHDRKFLEGLEQYLTDKVSLLELRVGHIKKRSDIQLINNPTLARLRDEPLSMANDDNYQRLFNNLRYEILEEIENNYSKFFDKENLR